MEPPRPSTILGGWGFDERQGLPAQIEASVAPNRERLDALLCEATLRLELIRNEKKGRSIHGH